MHISCHSPEFLAGMGDFACFLAVIYELLWFSGVRGHFRVHCSISQEGTINPGPCGRKIKSAGLQTKFSFTFKNSVGIRGVVSVSETSPEWV